MKVTATSTTEYGTRHTATMRTNCYDRVVEETLKHVPDSVLAVIEATNADTGKTRYERKVAGGWQWRPIAKRVYDRELKRILANRKRRVETTGKPFCLGRFGL